MQEIHIQNQDVDTLLTQLNNYLKGTLNTKWGETTLAFNNNIGKGTLKSISFDWGVSLIDYDVWFDEDIKIVFELDAMTPIEFIFISEGSFDYQHNGNKDRLKLQRYQNIIMSPLSNSTKTYFFPKGQRIKANFIQIEQKKYAKKKHNNIKYLNEVLLSVFEDRALKLPFQHLGNFNLKIADQVKVMHDGDNGEGIVRTLDLEGRLNIILALQILEHHRFEQNETLPESLTREDIKKIHRLSEFIVDHISEPMTIKRLSQESLLSPKKLQMGFQMLYNKTVNEYTKMMKMEIARDLLKNTEFSVSEVVYKVGIKSRSYFSKIFCEQYGILPTEYRSLLRRKV